MGSSMQQQITKYTHEEFIQNDIATLTQEINENNDIMGSITHSSLDEFSNEDSVKQQQLYWKTKKEKGQKK